MAGLSFLVSPETQEQQKQVGEQVQHGLDLAYGAEKQRQSLRAQEAINESRVEAAEKRAEAANSRAFTLQAQHTQAQMDQLHQRDWDSQVRTRTKEMSDQWRTQMGDLKAQKEAIVRNSNLYPNDQVVAYKDAFDQAEAVSSQKVNDYIDKYSRLKPDQTMESFDWASLPVYGLHYSLSNPAIAQKIGAQMDQIKSTVELNNARTAQAIQKMSEASPEARSSLQAMRANHANYIGANSYYNALVQSGVKEPITLADAKAKADAANAAYKASSAEAMTYGGNGHYGPVVQSAVHAMRQSWGEEAQEEPSGMTLTPTPSEQTPDIGAPSLGQPAQTGLDLNQYLPR